MNKRDIAEDLKSIKRAKLDFREGKTISAKEVAKKLGIKNN